jgi:glucose-1-phosphate thymidylyltransferase
VIKALIVAGSRGDDTASTLIGTPAPELLPVGNRAIVLRALDSLQRAGISEVALVVHRAIAHVVRAAVGDGSGCGLDVTYIRREAPVGIGDAILAAEQFLSGSPFLVQSGRGFSTAPLRPLMERMAGRHLHALLLSPPGGGADGDAHPEIRVFGSDVAECVRELRPSWRGQLDIDDVGPLLGGWGRIEHEPLPRWWSYNGTPLDLLQGNRLVLEQAQDSPVPASMEDCDASGRLVIHPTAIVRSSVIRGPVAIGAGAKVSDAYLGPYTAVGDQAVIEGVEIEDSVVLSGAEIRYIAERLHRSVVGRNARLFRDFRLPRACRLVVGKDAEIALA